MRALCIVTVLLAIGCSSAPTASDGATDTEAPTVLSNAGVCPGVELALYALSPSGRFLQSLALGGHVRIGLHDASVDGAAYEAPFTATSSDASVIRVDTDASGVVLTGVNVGAAQIRMTAPSGCILLERGVQVSDVARMVPSTSLSRIAAPLHAGVVASIWHGATESLTIQLSGSISAISPLQDDSFHAVGQPALIDPTGGIYEGLSADVTAPDAGALSVTLARDAGDATFTLAVATALAEIRFVQGGGGTHVGDTSSICAIGVAAGGMVAGAPITLALPPMLVADDTAVRRDARGRPEPGCTGVRAVSAGTGDVVASLDGASAMYTLTIAP